MLKPGSLAIALLIPMLFPALSPAETIIKSVDEEGNVTFSDQPPAQGQQHETIRLQVDRPSEAEAEAARKRHEQLSKTADTLARERRKKEEARRRQAAEQRKRELEQPQVIVIEKDQGDPYYWPGAPVRPVRPIKPGQPGIRPPGQRPPGQRPPVVRPPIQRPPAGRPPARPLPSGR